MKLHLFVDTCAVEVFVDDGRAAMANTIYPRPDSVNLKVFSVGAPVELVHLDIWGWSLRCKRVSYASADSY